MKSHSFPALPYLEAVAKLRYSISVVAELLHTQLTAERGTERGGGNYHIHEAHLLIEETKLCCSILKLNQEEAGPGVYLVKLLMRRYGPSFLTTLTSDPALHWVVPEHLRHSDDRVHNFFNALLVSSTLTFTSMHREWTGLSSMILTTLNCALHYWMLLIVNKWKV